jgi:acyl dehydratase
MSPRVFTSLAEIEQAQGEPLGTTDWTPVEQGTVDAFADLTGDHQWVHVDAERAAASPFGGTIAHGYLTVAMLAPISQELLDVQGATGVNYGMDRLRFPAPLPVGAEFRGSGEVLDVTEVKGGMQVKVTFTVEVRDQERPALVADCLFRYYA